jgi:hypothetical protein
MPRFTPSRHERRLVRVAMQKVEGSSAFIRSSESPAQAGFLLFRVVADRAGRSDCRRPAGVCGPSCRTVDVLGELPMRSYGPLHGRMGDPSRGDAGMVERLAEALGPAARI